LDGRSIPLGPQRNAQGARWSDTGKPNSKKLARSWRRDDGATARWQMADGLTLVTPAYERAKTLAEAKAKAEASRPPRI
jgi:hypothetical protein